MGPITDRSVVVTGDGPLADELLDGLESLGVAALLGAVGYAPYASSKEAIRALTRSAAREWGKFGITVNCLCPVSAAHRMPPGDEDPVRAKMFAETYANQPIPRDGDAIDDIGPVVQFLISDASRYMTGQTLMADGGAIMLI